MNQHVVNRVASPRFNRSIEEEDDLKQSEIYKTGRSRSLAGSKGESMCSFESLDNSLSTQQTHNLPPPPQHTEKTNSFLNHSRLPHNIVQSQNYGNNFNHHQSDHNNHPVPQNSFLPQQPASSITPRRAPVSIRGSQRSKGKQISHYQNIPTLSSEATKKLESHNPRAREFSPRTLEKSGVIGLNLNTTNGKQQSSKFGLNDLKRFSNYQNSSSFKSSQGRRSSRSNSKNR